MLLDIAPALKRRIILITIFFQSEKCLNFEKDNLRIWLLAQSLGLNTCWVGLSHLTIIYQTTWTEENS